MKFIIVLACLFAVACAGDHDARVIKSEAEVNVDNFRYAYELDNHIKVHQEGELHDKHLWIVKGEYEYIAPKGEKIHVSYHADDHGYQPVVHHDGSH